MVKSYTYDAYGNTSSTGSFVNSFAYTGAIKDTETDLYYMNARYYDPETGRFISEDTYRGDGEAFWHLYAYCNGDPVNNTDPTGDRYSRVKAALYILKWWNKRNPDFYDYGAYDCANFVSQCLYAGRIPMEKGWHSYRLGPNYFMHWVYNYSLGYEWVRKHSDFCKLYNWDIT